jgi:hypothetical protein
MGVGLSHLVWRLGCGIEDRGFRARFSAVYEDYPASYSVVPGALSPGLRGRDRKHSLIFLVLRFGKAIAVSPVPHTSRLWCLTKHVDTDFTFTVLHYMSFIFCGCM